MFQIWKCATCKSERHWGFGHPPFRTEVYKLQCHVCERATDHAFIRLEFDRENEDVWWGDWRPMDEQVVALRGHRHRVREYKQ
jgi:hypothetical protein